MRASWHALQAGLTRTTSTLGFQRRFAALTAQVPELARFPDPAALFDWLHGPGGDGPARNSVLRALARAAQADAEPAVTLLLLALWPGLDALHRRLLRWFRHDPDLLASEITARVTQNIHVLDLGQATWIAATLIRNAERDIQRALKAETSRAAGRPLTEEDAADWDAPPSLFAIAADLDADRAALVLADRLSPTLGADAGLVIAVAVQGARQHEAAAHLGCTPAAARKRYQRALGRLRQEFDAAA